MSDYDMRRLLMCKPGWSPLRQAGARALRRQRMVAKGPLPVEPELQLRIGATAATR
jgi:hypothetical protein